ncbi:esterase/lipase family protein [Candidatus Nitrospira bockiana]
MPSLVVVFVHGVLGWGDEDLRPGLRRDYFHGVRAFYRRRYAERVHLDLYAPAVQPVDSIQGRGRTLAGQLEAIAAGREGQGVHVIAHSMGGLDARWAIAMEGLAGRVASLTTIGTPHRGSSIARFVAPWLPVLHPMGRGLERVYRWLGTLWRRRADGEPVDPLEFAHRLLLGFHVSRDQARRGILALTPEAMARFNAELLEWEREARWTHGVVYVCYGGDMARPRPEDAAQSALLAPTHALLNCCGTPEERVSGNDGMVSVWSAHYPWEDDAAYAGTVSLAHFLQINWRFPDRRPTHDLNADLAGLYGGIMDRLLRIEAARLGRDD